MGLNLSPRGADKDVTVRVVTASGQVIEKAGIRRPLQSGRSLQQRFRAAVNQHLGADVVNVETGEVRVESSGETAGPTETVSGGEPLQTGDVPTPDQLQESAEQPTA